MLHSESMSRQLWILISNTMAPIGLSVAELPKQITDHAQDSGPLWSPHINSLFYAANMDGAPPRWPASPRVCRLSNAGQQSRRDGGGGHQVGGRLRQGGLRLLATQPAGSAHVRHAALFVAAPLPLHCLSTAVRYHMSVDDFLFMVEKWHALCTKYEHYVESEDEDEEVAVEPAALQPPTAAAAPDPMQVEDDDANRSSRRRKAPRADLSAPGDAKSKYNEWLADENKKKAAVLLERRREDAVTTLPLPCAPTAFVAKGTAVALVFPLPSWPKHCLFSLFFLFLFFFIFFFIFFFFSPIPASCRRCPATRWRSRRATQSPRSPPPGPQVIRPVAYSRQIRPVTYSCKIRPVTYSCQIRPVTHSRRLCREPRR